uniref:Uncharacterized protein n=1 Tax=Anguilla anguilla TaxID=7936 RepID=A0A0E9SFI4_ANGAN
MMMMMTIIVVGDLQHNYYRCHSQQCR